MSTQRPLAQVNSESEQELKLKLGERIKIGSCSETCGKNRITDSFYGEKQQKTNSLPKNFVICKFWWEMLKMVLFSAYL